MRQLIENPVYMTIDDIKATYNGKWVYIVKCNTASGNELLGGYPIVVADTLFEGDMEFYDQFDGKEFAPRFYRNYGRKQSAFFPTFPENEDEVFRCLVSG